MDQVVAVFDVTITEEINDKLEDIVLTQAKIVTLDFCKKILKLIDNDIEKRGTFVPSFIKGNYYCYNFRYFTKPEEICFLKEFYKLSELNYYYFTSMPNYKHWTLFKDFLRNELMDQHQHLSIILSPIEYKKYQLEEVKFYYYFDEDEHLYQSIYVQTLNLDDVKIYDYSHIKKIITSYILDDGFQIDLSDNISTIILYLDWRPTYNRLFIYSDKSIRNQYIKSQEDAEKIQYYLEKYPENGLYYNILKKNNYLKE